MFSSLYNSVYIHQHLIPLHLTHYSTLDPNPLILTLNSPASYTFIKYASFNHFLWKAILLKTHICQLAHNIAYRALLSLGKPSQNLSFNNNFTHFSFLSHSYWHSFTQANQLSHIVFI